MVRSDPVFGASVKVGDVHEIGADRVHVCIGGETVGNRKVGLERNPKNE